MAKAKKTEGAETAGNETLKDVLGRKVRFPRGFTVLRTPRNRVGVPTADGFRKSSIFLVPAKRAEELVAHGWGLAVADPLLDLTLRELIQLDSGETPVFD